MSETANQVAARAVRDLRKQNSSKPQVRVGKRVYVSDGGGCVERSE